jgi:hypothetical protein
MTLLALQRDLRAWLTDADAGAAQRFGASAAPGLRVYQNNYRAQLVECLEASFAQTRAWIGHEAFLAAAVTHIDRVPPSSWTLDAYGRDFPATLAILYPDDPEVIELAWLEFALETAFVGLDSSALTMADLAEIDWDRVALRMNPNFDLGDQATNATAIWSALAARETPPAVERLDVAGAVLVWRRGQVSCFRTVHQYERQALVHLAAGLSFAELCQKAVDAFGEQEGVARAGRWLACWVNDGLVVGFEERCGA